MSSKQFDPKAIEIIKRLTSNTALTEAINSSEDDFSFRKDEALQNFKDKKISGVQLSVPQERRDETFSCLQKTLGNGFTVYFSEQNFGHGPDEITVLETADKYDALRFEGCNGVNHDIYTEDIIAHLQELEQKHPFILTGAGFDFVQGIFLTPPSNLEDLAQGMYEFCPDIVDQGTGDIEGLVEELKNSNAFYYWWD